jgi:hypothetical protein
MTEAYLNHFSMNHTVIDTQLNIKIWLMHPSWLYMLCYIGSFNNPPTPDFLLVIGC